LNNCRSSDISFSRQRLIHPVVHSSSRSFIQSFIHPVVHSSLELSVEAAGRQYG
jgi:hypothetical protein